MSSKVQVAVRVRPLLPREVAESRRECVRVDRGEKQLIIGQDRSFTFDYVFRGDQAQAYVYEQSVQPLLESTLQGFNATVFAYGQTVRHCCDFGIDHAAKL